MRRFLVVLVLLIALTLPAGAADTFRLTILHTNDLHGMMRPFDYQGASEFISGSHPDAGGMARRAALISRLRRGTKHPVLVVDTGDLFADGPWSTKLYGIAEIEAMNEMGYDLFGVGNNEFQATFDAEAQGKMLLLLRRSRFPWLAANLTTLSGDPVEGIRPFVVRSFGGVRVAFMGLIPARVATYEWIAGWRTEDPVAAAQHWVPIARKEADIVIAITHLGIEEACGLLEQVPGIDAMVGGDSHTFTPQVVRLKSPSGAEVPYVQAGEKGVVLGKFDLTFTRDQVWRVEKAEETLLPVDSALPEDAAVRKLLERYLDRPAARALSPAWGHAQ